MAQRLPWILQVVPLAFLTIVLVVAGGTFLTLPPGPLCDEGMVLFMEGGCDWGNSNIFFFSKLGLLLGMNVAFLLAWRRRITDWRGFLPHFLVLGALTVLNFSDERCAHYYGHPNGSIGQMTLEAAAFAALGIAIVTRVPLRTFPRAMLALLAWNALHVAAFYAGLLFTNHWTWLHTIWIAAVLSAATVAITRRQRRRDRTDARP